MKKNNRAARAARFFATMFWRSLPNDDVKFSYLRFWWQRELVTENLSLCLYMKTMRTKQAKVHLAYFVQRDQHGIRELKQSRRRRQHKPHKFAYLTMKNSIFARFARTCLIFWHFEDVFVLSTTWSDLFFRCVDDASKWLQMFNFVHSCPKRWFQFNSRTEHFSQA